MSNNKKEAISKDSGIKGFINAADSFFSKRMKIFFSVALIALILLSLLLFQINISTGGDDSFYIIRAYKFYKNGILPSYQGPLYPLMLSPLVAIFGINVPILKTFSVFLAIIFFIFFYKAYKGRVGNTILVLSMFTIAFNHEIIYYASQTYNEMFHLALQMIFFFFFFKFYDKIKDRDTIFNEDHKDWLVIGFLLFLLALSKNVGLVGVMSVVGFFLFGFKWRSMLAAVGSFALFKGLYELFKRMIYGAEAQISRQGEMLLYKDPYNFSKGKEDFMGFVTRFVENSGNYLSKDFMRMLDLRDESVLDSIDFLTILLYGLMLGGLIISYKRNKYMFFTGIYLLATLVITFIVLQTRWDSNRLVFLVLPYFFLANIYTIEQILKRIKVGFLQPLFMIIMLLYVGNVFFSSTEDIDLIKTKKNLAGDKYLGYTRDWQNFLRISEWAGENLPDSYVASRKAGMSSIYCNGKEFYNITRVTSNDPDSLLDQLQENNVTHVIMAKLRKNPNIKTEYTINTVHRYLSTIERKYRYTFQLVHQEGVAGDEEAQLFEVHYEIRDSQR